MNIKEIWRARRATPAKAALWFLAISVATVAGCREGPSKIFVPLTPDTVSTPIPAPVRSVGLVLPFIWSPSEGMKAIPLPDPKIRYPNAAWVYSAKAMAVNSSGVVVGCFGSPTPEGRAFVWSADAGFLDIHPEGDGDTCATAVNDKGLVAGSANFWGRMGFVWKPGTNVQFLPLTKGETIVTGINEAGDVVGSAIRTAGSSEAFIWNARDGVRLLTSANDVPFTRAFDINDEGQVVGFDSRRTANGVFGATPVLWQSSTGARSGFAGEITNACDWQPDTGLQGGCAVAAVAINNSGAIAGTINGRAFRWEPETGLTTLQLPDGRLSIAVGINASGDIAGTAMTRDLKNRIAFVWKRSGEMTELGTLPEHTSSEATGINDLGQVVGYSQ